MANTQPRWYGRELFVWLNITLGEYENLGFAVVSYDSGHAISIAAVVQKPSLQAHALCESDTHHRFIGNTSVNAPSRRCKSHRRLAHRSSGTYSHTFPAVYSVSSEPIGTQSVPVIYRASGATRRRCSTHIIKGLPNYFSLVLQHKIDFTQRFLGEDAPSVNGTATCRHTPHYERGIPTNS